MAINDRFDERSLSDWVDHRSEEPSIEYKSWMDLRENETKAKIAKHLCALANFGGGLLVFGIADDGSYCEPHPENLDVYSQDVINGIFAKYLTPILHCSVVHVRSRHNGKIYPVVCVPRHGTAPVCAKKDGPFQNHKPIGISKGIHYTRVPGPRSVPADSPELWQDVIHRCVINERESLLSSIGRLFDRPVQIESTPDLDRWVDEAVSRWETVQLDSGWGVDPKLNRTAFAFRFIGFKASAPSPLNLTLLRDAISSSTLDEQGSIDWGWVYFAQAGEAPYRPTVALFGEVEGYEAVMVQVNGEYDTSPSLWRCSVDGRGAEVRTFHEDSEWVASIVAKRSGGTRAWAKGKFLCPRFQAARAYQFVSFVRAIGRYFEGVERIELVADYNGLSGRSLDDPEPLIYYGSQRSAMIGARRVHVTVSPEALVGEGGTRAASEMIAPLFRLFDGWEVTPDFVSSVVRQYKRR
jgi:hypothetical protein